MKERDYLFATSKKAHSDTRERGKIEYRKRVARENERNGERVKNRILGIEWK